VLITGCDTGFGNRLASRLNSLGYTVYATCLDPSGPGPQELLKTAKHPKALKLIAMNVTKDADVEQAKNEISQQLKKDGDKLWAIVNNAGIAILSFVEWGPLENYQKILDVNMIGMIRVTRAFLPLIRANKGRVINVASVAGRASFPGMSAYCISKYGVVAFSDSLRREMLPWGVKVVTIEPTFHRTPITDKEVNIANAKKVWDQTPEDIRKDYGQEYFDSIIEFMKRDENEDPENVVDKMVNAIASTEPEVRYYVCGVKYTIVCWLNEYLPFSVMDALIKIVGPGAGGKKPAAAAH
jgi:NAD(P)-dependent dehydrogenase (short-subunit alcohol dehydrogenase family)